MTERMQVSGEWQRVSTRYAWLELVTDVVVATVIGGALFVMLKFIWNLEWPVVLAVTAIPFVFFGCVGAFALMRVRRIGYLFREDDLLVRRGMLFRRFVAVPYGRMQIVDITQGPIERMLKLKTLKFVTAAAASAVTIPGLTGDLAEELRDRLVAAAESRRAGL